MQQKEGKEYPECKSIVVIIKACVEWSLERVYKILERMQKSEMHLK